MSRLLSAFTPRRSLLACGDHQLSLQQYHEVTCIRPRNTKTLSSAARQRSLFEELFPEESPSVQPNPVCSQIENDITPRLRLPEDGGVEESLKLDPSKQRPCTSSIIFSTFRSWDLAILVLSRVSNSLLDDDFRRVAPHGQHIDDWKGPGDILKVIPVRDPSTLQQNGRYYVLFPNPACARAYQNQTLRLSRLAHSRTPTSLEKQIDPFPSVYYADEEILCRVSDYTLSPSSTLLQLKTLPAPFHSSVKHLLSSRGYPQIMEPREKTNRGVLLWIDGSQLTTSQLKQAIRKDGDARAAPWALENQGDPIVKMQSPAHGDSLSQSIDPRSILYGRRLQLRWTIEFEDEAEARRFVRSWHRRVLDVEVAETLTAPMANCRVLW